LVSSIHLYVSFRYGVATLSRIDKIVGLFCKRALYKRRYSAKETCHFIDPTDHSHPIYIFAGGANAAIVCRCSIVRGTLPIFRFLALYLYIYNSYIYMFSSGCLLNVSLVGCIHVCHTKTFLESSRCRTPPLETSVYRPRLTCSWYTLGIDVSSESMV